MRVTAIDATVYYASIAALLDDGTVKCGGITTPTPGDRTERSLAEDHALHVAFAAKIVATVTRAEKPALVVLRRPSLGIGAGGRRTGRAAVRGGRVRRFEDYTPRTGDSTGEGDTGKKPFAAESGERLVTLDSSAIRRLAVHWELVRQFSEAGVPIAEIGVFSAEEALRGGYTTNPRVGARATVQGYGACAKLTQELYAGTPLEARNSDGSKDSRFRVSTVALAALGALVVKGVPSPVAATEPVWETLRRGATFPCEFPLPRRGDLTTGKTRGSATAKFYEDKEAEYDELTLDELEEMAPRTNDNLKALRDNVIARKRAQAEEGVDPMLAAEQEAEAE